MQTDQGERWIELCEAQDRGTDDGALPIKRRCDGNLLTLEVLGELDMANAAVLDDELLRAQDSNAELIILDLRGLDFIDVAGLRILLQASRRSTSDSDRLRIVRGTGPVARLMKLTAVDQELTLID